MFNYRKNENVPKYIANNIVEKDEVEISVLAELVNKLYGIFGLILLLEAIFIVCINTLFYQMILDVIFDIHLIEKGIILKGSSQHFMYFYSIIVCMLIVTFLITNIFILKKIIYLRKSKRLLSGVENNSGMLSDNQVMLIIKTFNLTITNKKYSLLNGSFLLILFSFPWFCRVRLEDNNKEEIISKIADCLSNYALPNSVSD